jgi:hypothetical protein
VLQSTEPIFQILRRRVAWVIGRWVENLGVARPAAYQALLLLLSNSDFVTRMTATASFARLVNDCNFDASQFMEHLHPVCEQLFQLLSIAPESEGKLHVLNLISLLIERMEDKILPLVPRILVWIPQLWKEAAEHNLLKSAVVVTLQRLVSSLGVQSDKMYDIVLPVLAYATAIGSADELYLLEDGLELWRKVLANASAASAAPLLSLYPNVVVLLSRDFEHHQISFSIIESYVLLYGSNFMQHYGAELVILFSNTLGNIKDRGTIILLNVLSTIFCLFPVEAPQLFLPVLLKMKDMILNKSEADHVVAGFIGIFARVAIQSVDFFFQLFQPNGESAIAFLDTWLEKVDNLVSTRNRKLSALALSSMLATTEARLLEYSPLIVSVCVDVLHEVGPEEQQAEHPVAPSQVHEGVCTEGGRKQAADAGDVASRTMLTGFVQAKLRACKAMNSPEVFRRVFGAIDPAILQQLRQFIPLEELMT